MWNIQFAKVIRFGLWVGSFTVAHLVRGEIYVTFSPVLQTARAAANTMRFGLLRNSVG